MSNSIKTTIKLPLPAFSIIILFVAMMIIGIAVIPLLSVQLEPSQTLNSVSINVSWPDASAQILEEGVTMKIEGLISTVKGIKNIRSTSSTGYGYIRAELDEHANIKQVRYEIATMIRQLYPKLPLGVRYPTIYANQSSKKTNKSILSYTINGKTNAAAIQQFTQQYIKPQLALLNGVYEVNIYGASSYAWELYYNQTDALIYSITERDINSAVKSYFNKYELGKVYVSSHGQQGKPTYTYLTLTTERKSLTDWSKIPIKTVGARTIYLTDIVKVQYTEQEPQSFYRINGLNTVNLEIVAADNANYIVMAGNIKEKIAAIQRNLPQGYSIILAYDATEYLKTELNKIAWRSAITLLILLAFVLLVSRQLQYLLLIFISLICNLLLAFIVYYFLHLDIHLYSLAAITISMGMIIDNSIVVIDHVRHKQNLRVILAIGGATLTTIGSVCIVFFLDEKQQVKLLDFAWVMIINLGISLVIAFCFIPALMEKIPIPKQKNADLVKRKRRGAQWNRFYSQMITLGLRYKVYLLLVLILLFGIPIFMLPAKIEQNNKLAMVYNKSIGSDFYNESIRPWADKLLGGTLRLFLSSSDRLSSYSEAAIEKTRLTVNITMPVGASIRQMNNIVLSFENYLSQFKEIEQFQSRIYSGQKGAIVILFKRRFENGAFPYNLKSQLESKAIYTGLAEFSIHGVGQGFNNELNTESANYALELQGYNYDKLYSFAEQIKGLLQQNPRVEKVTIASERDWTGEKSSYEYVFHVNSQQKLLVSELSPKMINQALVNFSGDKSEIRSVLHEGNYVPIILSPINKRASVWQVLNEPVRSESGAYVRLKEFATIDKENAGDQILRVNQQYQIVVNYNFIGDNYLGTIIAEKIINEVSSKLPIGYSVKETKADFWRGSKEKLTWAILLTIGIVFVICSILLNSIIQPIIVISIIPISFIGVFLSVCFVDYRFDEGGYAAFIILCGVVVNAVLFILNDYNNMRRDYPQKPVKLLFIKAYNSKIIPVMLSTASMILGLIPFMVYSKGEPFWYALAMGVTGGLLFSMIGVVIFLPLFLKDMSLKKCNG